MTEQIRVISLVILFILSLSCSGYSSPLDAQLRSSTTGLNQLQNKQPACPAVALKKNSGCPNVIGEMIEQDRSDSNFGMFKSIYPICRKNLSRDDKAQTFPSAIDLAQHFEKYQGASLGPVVQSQIRRCLQGSEKDSKEILAKYYYNFSRVETSQVAAVQEMASIDQMLGQDILSGFKCDKASFASIQKNCETIKKSCSKNSGGLQALVDKTIEAKNDIAEIEAHQAALQDQLFRMDRRSRVGAEAAKLREQISAADFAISLISSRVSWSSGSEYQKRIKNGQNEVDAIKAQLLDNRKALELKYGNGEVANMCLSGAMSKSCTAERVRNYIDKTPIPPDSLDFKKGDSKEKALGAYEYMRFEQCVHDGTTDRLAPTSTFNHAFFDAGLAIATLGLGAVYMAPKLLVSARGVMIAKYARLADQGFNATILGKGVAKAALECSSSEKDISLSPAKLGQCSIENVYQGSQALEKYDSCVSAVVWAAVDGTPFAGGVLQKWARARQNMNSAEEAAALVAAKRPQTEILDAAKKINDRTDGGAGRLQFAEKTLGRKLSRDEKDWILAGHNKHSDKAYKTGDGPAHEELSNADLKDKLKGRPKTMTPAETRKLIVSGALGGDGLPGAAADATAVGAAAGKYSDLDPVKKAEFIAHMKKMSPQEAAQHSNLPDRVRAELMKEKPDFDEARRTTASSLRSSFDNFYRASGTDKISYLNRIEQDAALLGIQSRNSNTMMAKSKEIYLNALREKMKIEVKGDPAKAKIWLENYFAVKKSSLAKGVDGEADRWAAQTINEALENAKVNPKDLVLDPGSPFRSMPLDDAVKVGKRDTDAAILEAKAVLQEPASMRPEASGATTVQSGGAQATQAVSVTVNPRVVIKRTSWDTDEILFNRRVDHAAQFHAWSGGETLTNAQSEFLFYKVKTYSSTSGYQFAEDMRKLGFSDEQTTLLRLGKFEVGPNKEFIVKPISPEMKKKVWSNFERDIFINVPEGPLSLVQAQKIATEGFGLQKFDADRVRDAMVTKMNDLIGHQNNLTEKIKASKTQEEVASFSEARKAHAAQCRKILSVFLDTKIFLLDDRMKSYKEAVSSGNCSYK